MKPWAWSHGNEPRLRWSVASVAYVKITDGSWERNCRIRIHSKASISTYFLRSCLFLLSSHHHYNRSSTFSKKEKEQQRYHGNKIQKNNWSNIWIIFRWILLWRLSWKEEKSWSHSSFDRRWKGSHVWILAGLV